MKFDIPIARWFIPYVVLYEKEAWFLSISTPYGQSMVCVIDFNAFALLPFYKFASFLASFSYLCALKKNA